MLTWPTFNEVDILHVMHMSGGGTKL